MSTYNIMTEVETQVYQIELSLAVLNEISNYFAHRDEYEYLPHYAEHISNLLNVTITLLHNTVPEFEKAVDALQEKATEERDVKAD